MSYTDELKALVNETFDEATDEEDLRKDILKLVIAKSKESFKNGLETARKRQARPNVKKAYND